MASDQTRNQQFLEKKKAEFTQRYPAWAPELFAFLERDESFIAWANLWDNWRLGAIRVAPCSAISKQFDISLEIPLLVATFAGETKLEPRLLRHLDTSPQLRLSTTADKDVAILVASDPRAVEFVKDRKRFAFPILVIQTEDLEAGAYRDRTLRAELASLMRSVNHFENTNEIQRAADFFGRVDDLEVLTSLAATGQSVGVFGLRRAGKTSLLHRVAEALEEREILTIYVELNAVIDADGLREALVQEMARLAKRLGAPLPANSEMLNGDGSIRSSTNVAKRWIYEVDALLDQVDRNVVFVLDETDLANEDAEEFDDLEVDDRRSMNLVLQQLRGLIQIRNKRGKTSLSFLSAGVAASVYTKAIRFGRDNQLFGFASARMLGAMSRDEMREMVRGLGKRSGLKFDDYRLFNRLFDEYGGHPHLTRQACSRVAEYVHSRQDAEVPYQVKVEDLENAFRDMGENSPAQAAWQTLQSFNRWYPEEGRIVRELAAGRVPLAELAEITHAVGFGLCNPDGTLRMAALRRCAS